MLDVMIEKYVALRDKKAQMDAAHKLAVSPITEAMEKVELVLLQAMNDQGLSAFKSDAGTAYKATKTGARIADRESLREFLSTQDDPYHYIDLKVNKTAVDEYVAEHGSVPPGVDYYSEITVNVRRS
jgi:hypothetical protein